jgi:hypothetical protein
VGNWTQLMCSSEPGSISDAIPVGKHRSSCGVAV